VRSTCLGSCLFFCAASTLLEGAAVFQAPERLRARALAAQISKESSKQAVAPVCIARLFILPPVVDGIWWLLAVNVTGNPRFNAEAIE